MPAPSVIYEGLARIASNSLILAVIWHIVFGLAIIGFIAGWRPSRKLAAAILAVPLLSVSILAWVYKNPFNGAVFLIFAILLALVGLYLPKEKVEGGPLWNQIAGVLMIAFGWIYPHFLASGEWWKYLYAAPTGLIPCPTLSVIIGFALLAGGFASRTWSGLLAVLGLFYGVFGAFRLGVELDMFLLLGALLLLIQSLTIKLPQRPVQT
jgi:hypothetical protein